MEDYMVKLFKENSEKIKKMFKEGRYSFKEYNKLYSIFYEYQKIDKFIKSL